jgi:hypothetical protein
MAGGILNLVATGSQNVILNGNPDKTFFKTRYSKYTNFGLQKFRIDFNGLRTLKLSEESNFTFKVPRYADLLMDTYVVITMPHIWSPIFPPNNNNRSWIPYEFQWIDNLGSQLIKEISITCGGQLLQKYSGSYIMNMVNRDFSEEKKNIFNKMTGNINEMNDPANIENRSDTYPNCFYTSSDNGAYPSIFSRKLYIPINAWFTLNSKMAFPLISTQNSELHINVTLRSIEELFTIRDVEDYTNNYPRIRPNFNNIHHQFYRFLQTPPSVELTDDTYGNKQTLWNADIHLIANYCFLSEDERRLFAAKDQTYLVKTIHEHKFNDIVGTKKVELQTMGLVSNWMFALQRNDVYLRNEWSNYSNWPYKYIPQNIYLAENTLPEDYVVNDAFKDIITTGPGVNVAEGSLTNLYVRGDYTNVNIKNILDEFGILFDGNYRENLQDFGIYEYIEKYARSNGNAPSGLYCYNFSLNSSPFELQPSGAINMSMIKKIELEISTHVPELNEDAQVLTICDNENNVIAINKPTWIIYDYTYDLYLFEEKYNILTFTAGNCGWMYTR